MIPKCTLGSWLESGWKLEVDWKWIGSRLEETGSRLKVNWKKLEGDWYKSGSTKFWGSSHYLFQFVWYLFCFFLQCTTDNQWYLSIPFFLAESRVLGVSTKMDYISPKTVIVSPNFIERKKLIQKCTLRSWLESGWKPEVDWKWIGSRLEETGSRLEVN